MSKLKSFLRDAGYFGIGAAAVLVEAGSKAVSALVRKGEKTLRDNQDTVDDIKRRAREAGEKLREAMDKAAAQPDEPDVPEPEIPDEPGVPEPEIPDEPDVPEPEVPDEPDVPEPEVPEKPADAANG